MIKRILLFVEPLLALFVSLSSGTEEAVAVILERDKGEGKERSKKQRKPHEEEKKEGDQQCRRKMGKRWISKWRQAQQPLRGKS